MPRSKLDDIVDEICGHAGADFAFVLTRRGRLITLNAPSEMPEAGRLRIVKAAKPVVGSTQTVQVTLARQELVPYGGAAPVDVYLAVAREQAILCLVMSTWADKRPIIPAMLEGISLLAPALERTKGGGIPAAIPRGRGSDRGRPPTGPPPPRAAARPPPPPPPAKTRRRGAMTGLVGLIGGVPTASRALEQPVVVNTPRTPPPPPMRGSIPEIHVGEATLGRESLEAVDRELNGGSLPEIAVSEGRLGLASIEAVNRELNASSLPDIAVSEGRLGLASLEAIAASSRAPVASAPENVRVELVSMSRASEESIAIAELEDYEEEQQRPDPGEAPMGRFTRPWVEPPVDSRRADAAARSARGAQPPKVSLKLEPLDAELEESLVAELDAIARAPESGRPPPPEAPPRALLQAPNVVDAHDASGGVIEPLFAEIPPRTPPPPKPVPPASAKRKPTSSYEIWREALTAQIDATTPRRKTRLTKG